jgi:prevent-host-death family protein
LINQLINQQGANMEQIYSATQARIHFGEIMRRARQGPVIVERDGVQEVVVISKQTYDRLTAAAPQPDWRQLLKEAHESIRDAIGDRQLPDPAEMIHLAREERDEQLLDSLR